MLDIVLAAILLAASEDVDPNLIEVLRPTIMAIAINSEILDPKEQKYLLTQDFVGDLVTLQNRDQEFNNYPRAIESKGYPDPKNFLAMNRAYRANLIKRLDIDLVHEDLIRGAIVETDQLYQVWDTIRDAQCDYYYITVRRQALKLLRDLIGDEAFYSGYLPPSIPYWHIGS